MVKTRVPLRGSTKMEQYLIPRKEKLKSMERVRVKCAKNGPIPGLGIGPIRTPISISKEKYDNLVALGFPVEVVKAVAPPPTGGQTPAVKEAGAEASTPIQVPHHKPLQHTELVNENTGEQTQPLDDAVQVSGETKKTVDGALSSDPLVQPNPDDLTDDKLVDTNQGDLNDGETEEEESIIMNDPDGSAEAYYEITFLVTKAQCQGILDNRKVQYKSNASLDLLKKAVMESNPDVVFDEE